MTLRSGRCAEGQGVRVRGGPRDQHQAPDSEHVGEAQPFCVWTCLVVSLGLRWHFLISRTSFWTSFLS